MRLPYLRFCVLICSVVLFSCKNDVKSDDPQSDTETSTEVTSEPVKNAPPTQENLDRSNSVMARVMSTKETKTYATYLITAEMSDRLLSSNGTYTVFAPSDTAILALDAKVRDSFPLMSRREQLVSMVKAHIVEGVYDSVTIIQELKQGKMTLTTVGGETLSVSRSGNEIRVKDSKGNEAMVGKSDINASNGVVHVVDGVLGLD